MRTKRNNPVRSALLIALVLVLIAGAAFAGIARASAAPAAASATATQAPVATQAPAATQAPVVTDPGKVTYAGSAPVADWTPSTAYLELGATAQFDVVVTDPSAIEFSFDVVDSTAVTIEAESVETGEHLKATMTVGSNTIKLESLNGKAIGHTIAVLFTAVKPGLVFPYAYANASTPLVGPAVGPLYNKVNADLSIQKVSDCENYTPADQKALTATLTLLPNTGVTSVTRGPLFSYQFTVNSNNVLIVNSLHGMGIGANAITVCLVSTADNAPMGVPTLPADPESYPAP
jgi:hypothetical protein